MAAIRDLDALRLDFEEDVQRWVEVREQRRRRARQSQGKAVVCRFWIRGLCTKADECEFLHRYDISRMQECRFFKQFGRCNKIDCEFLHLSREKRLAKECPNYLRGFCPQGPDCALQHIRRFACPRFLEGFCPDGPRCAFGHPKAFERVVDEGKQHPTSVPSVWNRGQGEGQARGHAPRPPTGVEDGGARRRPPKRGRDEGAQSRYSSFGARGGRFQAAGSPQPRWRSSGVHTGGRG